MSYVYLHVPPNMLGSLLYPMNKLADINKDVYRLYKAGYVGREHLLERKIPYLDCLWNDVLHCSPVHPRQIIIALEEAGITHIPQNEYFEIDTVASIDINIAVIFYRNSDKFGDVRFEPASNANWDQVNIIPPITLKHYNDVAKTGESLFPYHGIPHFLYEGTIETKNLRRLKPY